MGRKLVFVFLALMGVAWARIVCNDFCHVIRCPGVTPEKCEKEGKEFREKGSVCGCCDICIDYLDDGEQCNVKADPIITVGGPYIEKHCKPSSECQESVCKQTVLY